jgi:uncharacterized membrane protein YfcA
MWTLLVAIGIFLLVGIICEILRIHFVYGIFILFILAVVIDMWYRLRKRRPESVYIKWRHKNDIELETIEN